MSTKRIGVLVVAIAGGAHVACSGGDSGSTTKSDDSSAGRSVKGHGVGEGHLGVLSIEEAAEDPAYVRVPGGHYLHRSCVHEVASGSLVRTLDDGTLNVSKDGKSRTYEGCKYPRADVSMPRPSRGASAVPAIDQRWVECSTAIAPNNGGRKWFNGLTGDFLVPPEPLDKNGATIFLFNSLQSGTTSIAANCTHAPTAGQSPIEIVQPVLQYGHSDAGGGNFWAFAAWYIDRNGNGSFTTLIPVAVNSVLSGIIAGSGCSTAGVCSSWFVGVGPVALSIFDPGSHPFLRADQAVLEALNVDSCRDYPAGGTLFGNTRAYQPPPTGSQNSLVEMAANATWVPSSRVGLDPDCSYTVTPFNRGATLSWSN